MRRILITNDDGIGSDGIRRLAEAAKQFGEVWVVAPETQRSAASHCITLHSPIDIYPYDFPVEEVHAYSCSGSPADCVRIGSQNIMPEKPDVVFTGINFGYNIASDVQYSATVGAALEAEYLGYFAIAFSEDAKKDHEVTDAYLETVIGMLIDRKDEMGPGQILNVNFPGYPLSEYKGIREKCKVSRAVIYRDHYNEIEALADGGKRFMVEGVYQNHSEEGTDFRAVKQGYISIGVVNNLQ